MTPNEKTQERIREFQRLRMAEMRKTPRELTTKEATDAEMHSKPQCQMHQVWRHEDLRKVCEVKR